MFCGAFGHAFVRAVAENVCANWSDKTRNKVRGKVRDKGNENSVARTLKKRVNKGYLPTNRNLLVGGTPYQQIGICW